jgi:hypothetical protein
VKLLTGLNAIKGAEVVPLYAARIPAPATGAPVLKGRRRKFIGGGTVAGCAAMRALAALGTCAPGLSAAVVNDQSLYGDNPKYDTAPIVSASSLAYAGNLTTLALKTVLVRTDSPATLERVRTDLAVNAPPQENGGNGSSPTPPRTFGETLGIRLARAPCCG